MTQLILSNSIQSYLLQINKLPLLTAEDEFDLAIRFKKQNDIDAVHKLITSNLRFVVKIAFEYSNYGFRLADLIQEGNIGLMKAVKKFDPHRGYRLITYAVWWIRSHIQAFILKNWSLVSKDAIKLKKRLFYQPPIETFGGKLEKNNEHIEHLEKSGQDGYEHSNSRSSKDKKFKEVDSFSLCRTETLLPSADMEYRDLSLDRQIGEDDTATYLDMLPDTAYNPEDTALAVQEDGIVKEEIANAIAVLNQKERYVIENRFISEPPLTLQDIGDKLGITRERVRQIENEAIKKLSNKKELQVLAKTMGS